jgi:predicted enzyme related to lactoylglutathione lyase
MSITEDRTSGGGMASVKHLDLKLEVVVIPVSDMDHVNAFYGGLGWRLDADFSFDKRLPSCQFTPPGSGTSIQFGTDMTSAAPGSVQNLYLVVSDIEAAREELVAQGAAVSEVFHPAVPAAQFHPDMSGHLGGRSPDSYASFPSFSDPDGNGWLLQEMTTRPPGPIDSAATSFGSASDLANAMRRASIAHGHQEKPAGRAAPRTGEADPNWPGCYSEYMVAQQAGAELPT